MHELSLCHSLLDQLNTLAAREQASIIRRVVLRIGPLAGVEPRLLQSAFPVAAAGTRAAGALLEIEAAPLRIRCLACGEESSTTPSQLLCGQCHSPQTQLVSGDELLLVRLEFEETRPTMEQ